MMEEKIMHNQITARTLMVLPCIGLMLLVTAGCASFQTVDKTKAATVSLTELKAEIARKAGDWKLPSDGIIIKIDKGVSVPLKIKATTLFAAIEPGTNQLRFTQDLYLFLAPKMFKLSSDGERWVNLGDWKGLQRLFGGKGGHFLIGVGLSKEEGALVSVDVGMGNR